MADVIDIANDRAERDLALRIAAVTQAKGPGRSECDDCGEPISPLRQQLGAVRCIDCQQAAEHHQRTRAAR